MNDADYKEFCDYVADTVDLIVFDNSEVDTKFERSDEGIVITVTGTRKQIAAVVGREAATVIAMQRIFIAIARRMQFKGDIRIRRFSTDGNSPAKKRRREVAVPRTGRHG